jgi:putative hydrolase of the HAD superfamily
VKRTTKYAAAEQALGLPAGSLRDRLFVNQAWELVKRGRISEAEFWRRVLPLVGLPPADLPAGPLAFILDEQIDPRVVALAERVHRRYRTALLSNATVSYDQRWQQFGLVPLFDVMVNSARVGLAKPEPEVYRLTLDRLGVQPAEALFVDDKERNTRAAEALGMPSLVFSDAGQLERELVERLDLRPEGSDGPDGPEGSGEPDGPEVRSSQS